jgi:dCMP deaminase
MNEINKWHQRFFDLAKHVAQWSKDPSTKVGAVIVNDRRIVIGVGYNGFPRGVLDHEDRYNDRPTKYAHVVHAELNAIFNATESVQGCTLYVTLAPCNECAKAIIQSGITSVWSPWYQPERRDVVAIQMMAEANVRHHCPAAWAP